MKMMICPISEECSFGNAKACNYSVQHLKNEHCDMTTTRCPLCIEIDDKPEGEDEQYTM